MNRKLNLSHPVSQGIAAFLLFIVFSLVFLPVKGNFPEILARENAYVVHAIVLLIFIFVNSVSVFSARNEKSYWMYSLYAFTGLLISGILASAPLTGIGIRETKSFLLIYPLLCGCYLVIFTIATLIKKILIYANRES